MAWVLDKSGYLAVQVVDFGSWVAGIGDSGRWAVGIAYFESWVVGIAYFESWVVGIGFSCSVLLTQTFLAKQKKKHMGLKQTLAPADAACRSCPPNRLF